MGSSKSAQKTNDYYGSVAGVICQGQLDFVCGLLVNNNLAWPDVNQWDHQANNSGKVYIYTDGNAYKALKQTGIDPPSFPWELYATVYSAGAYLKGQRVVSNNQIWQASANTSTAPPTANIYSSKTAYLTGQYALVYYSYGVQQQYLLFQAQANNQNSPPSTSTTNPNPNWTLISTVPWSYVSSPPQWSNTAFWAANSVVAWLGQLWTTPTATKTEPGQPGATWVLWKVNRTDVGNFNPNGDNEYTAGNPLKATAVNYGDFFIYWGTPDQQLDNSGNENYLRSLTALNPLPYRNKALIVLQNFDFGTEQSTPPSITVLGGRNPVQSLIVGNSAQLDSAWQCNPWVVLAELLTHPVFGLGLPVSWFNQAAWQAEADFCAQNTPLYYISPIYTDLRKVRELVQDILGYPDAFIFWNTLGQITAGHWPHGAAAPAWSTLNTINRDDCTEEIAWDSGLWGDTQNSISLSYQDVQTGFRNRPIFAPNLFNANVIKRLQSKGTDRPHITRYAQAAQWASEMAKLAGDQIVKGELTIQAEKAAGVQPGSIFLLTDDVLDVSFPCRCTRVSVSAPPNGTRKITFELEKGISPQPYAPTNSGVVTTNPTTPTLITSFAVIELPVALTTQGNSIALVCGRNDALTSGVQLWYQSEDDNSFSELGVLKGFGVPGAFDVTANSDETLVPYGDTAPTVALGQTTKGHTYQTNQENFWQWLVQYANNSGMSGATTAINGVDYTINPNTGAITILAGGSITTGDYVTVKVWNTVVIAYNQNTPQTDLDTVTGSITLDEFNDGEILLIAIQANNPGVYEIMSVGSITAGGNGTGGTPVWVVEVQRSFFGTQQGGDGSYVWGTNPADQVFIIPRSALVSFYTASFTALAEENSFATLLIVPFNAWTTPDVTDVFDPASNPTGVVTQITYWFVNPFLPDVSFNLLLQNGNEINFATATFASTDVLDFAFTVNDILGELTETSLVAVGIGQQEITLWHSTFPATSIKIQNVSFSLPNGVWEIQVRMWNNAQYDGATPVMYNNAPFFFYVGTTTSPTPTLNVGTIQGTSYVGYSLNTPSGIPGLQVYYQLQNIGTPLNPASWIAATLTGSVWPLPVIQSGQVLYAYSTATSLTNSPNANWQFRKGPH